MPMIMIRNIPTGYNPNLKKEHPVKLNTIAIRKFTVDATNTPCTNAV